MAAAVVAALWLFLFTLCVSPKVNRFLYNCNMCLFFLETKLCTIWIVPCICECIAFALQLTRLYCIGSVIGDQKLCYYDGKHCMLVLCIISQVSKQSDCHNKRFLSLVQLCEFVMRTNERIKRKWKYLVKRDILKVKFK